MQLVDIGWREKQVNIGECQLSQKKSDRIEQLSVILIGIASIVVLISSAEFVSTSMVPVYYRIRKKPRLFRSRLHKSLTEVMDG